MARHRWQVLVDRFCGKIRSDRENRFSALSADRVKSSRASEKLYRQTAKLKTWRASGRISGIHGQDCASDIAAALAQQIFDHAGHVVRLRQAAQRAAAGDALTLLGAEIVCQFSIDEAGRDRVHGNTDLADLA